MCFTVLVLENVCFQVKVSKLNKTVVHIVTVLCVCVFVCVTCHRMKESTLHGLFSLSLFPNIPSAVELAKVTNSDVQNMVHAFTNKSFFTLYVFKCLHISVASACFCRFPP